MGDREEHDITEYDSQSEEDFGTWEYGDGICPSQSQFNRCFQSSYETWGATSAMSLRDGTFNVSHMDAFLDLLRDVPPFFHNPPQCVDITGGGRHPLVLRLLLEVGTTDDLACDQRLKAIDYFQCLGFRQPRTYNTPPPLNAPLTHSLDRESHFTSIVLAWSYIICCRWVEILQYAGEQSLLQHAQDGELQVCFWDLVIHSRWSALVKRANVTSYAPWMLTQKGKKLNPSQSVWDQVPPDSSLAFDILLEFCTSKGLEKEFLLGLGTILMLTSRNVPTPRLNSPTIISRRATLPVARGSTFHRLFESLDKCMSLSATQDGLDSLLCSTFFDPGIPCNLVGAASLGIRKALFPADNNDFQRLLQAIADQKCHMSFLWHAVVYSHQATKVLTMALSELPPICLAAAFWTNIKQSFLQITYELDSSKSGTFPRVDEFIRSYYCQPEASVPWTPAPPFSSTCTENLSLHVRSHYQHRHAPLSWKSCWVQLSGMRIPATLNHQIKPTPPVQIQYFDTANEKESIEDIQPHIRDPAEEQSWSATSRLFNWHRYTDDGLWLDDGTRNIEEIRQLQQHPWIIDQFDSGRSDPLDEDEDKPPDIHWENIIKWRAEAELSRPAFHAEALEE